MPDAALGIDVGTQGVRAVVRGGDGAILATAQEPWPLPRPGPHGEVEQDPDAWWTGLLATAARAVAGSPEPIGAVTVSATSGTLVLADASLRPVRPAMLWNDKRAVREAAEAARRLGDPAMRPGFTLAKALWVRRHEPAEWRRTHHVLSAGDWLLARLTGGAPVTDYTNALKSGADLAAADWPAALDELGVDRDLLPPILPPATRIGGVAREVAAHIGVAPDAEVSLGVTDATASQIAAGVVDSGDWVTTIGTGLSVKGVSAARVLDATGLVYSHRHWHRGWIPTGTSHCGGDAITAGFPGADLDRLSAAATRPSSILVLPLATTGEYFPFRAPDATGFELGAPRDEADRLRGHLEGVGFVERLAMERMDALGAGPSGAQATMGGGARNDAWMRLRASILHRPTRRPGGASSAAGAAVVAAAGGPASISATARRTATVLGGAEFDPDPGETAHYDERYGLFLEELRARGYLETIPG